MMIFLFLISSIGHAKLIGLPEDQAFEYEFKRKIKKSAAMTSSKKRPAKRNRRLDELLEKLEKNDSEMARILERNNNKVIVKKSEDKLQALSRLKGMLLNSILATNIKPTTILIRLEKQEYFEKAQIRCQGISFGKRIQAKCDLLVTPDNQYKIDGQLWDVDGAEGIITDQFYSGKEKAFLTSSFASFFEGVLDGARDKIVTPFGETARVNAKNKVLGGLMNVAGNASDLIKESSEKNLQVGLVNSGKEVVVFFNKQVKL